MNSRPSLARTPLRRQAKTLLAASLLALTGSRADAQILDQTFNPSPNSNVYSLALQSDDKLLVGGAFTAIAGASRSNLARLNPNGTLDTTFLPAITGQVYIIRPQPDGRILIGGTFATVNGLPRGRVARLNANGTLDTTFAAEVGTGIVRAMVVQSDGKIVIGGAFSSVGPQARSCAARLNADGSLDESFSADAADYPTANATTVLDMALHPDGGILIAGQFMSLKGQLRAGLGRILPNGTLDETFNAGPVTGTAPVAALAVQRDGKILVGGSNFYIGTTRRYLARLNRDGTLDTSFASAVNSAVFTIAEQADGRVVFGGVFSNIDSTPRSLLARLLPGGTLDTGFTFDASGALSTSVPAVEALVAAPDGRIFVGGTFTTIASVTRNGLARIVPSTLQVVSHPADATAAPGGTAAFSVTVTGASPTYQWRKDGVPILGATSATYSIAFAVPGDAGAYDVVVTNSLGSVTSRVATLSVPATARLANVSVRTTLAAAQSLIVGFVVSRGSTDVLVRAAGPALGQFGLATAMADPKVELYRDSTKLLENDNWPATLADMFARVGAFPFQPNSRDSALMQTVSGGHSVIASGTSSGVVLVETYDAGVNQAGRLVNISARNRVGRDADILIAGFSVSGLGTMRVLIRAVGPTIAGAPFGVPDVLADPALEVFSASGTRLAANDNWDPSLATTFAAAGAFPLVAGSKDSAMVVLLTGGQNYTAQVKGADGGTGVALVEVFELP